MTKEQFRITIGKNIRRERNARKLSIEELAELLNFTPGFIYLMERGYRGTTSFTLYRLAELFETTVDGLINGCD